MDYQRKFNERVNLNHLTDNPFDRVSNSVLEALNSNDYCIDVHAHLFDGKCIDLMYFLKKFFFGSSKVRASHNLTIEELYNKFNTNDPNWEDSLLEAPLIDILNVQQLDKIQLENIEGIDDAPEGLIDYPRIFKFGKMSTMKEVYDNYLKNNSVNKITGNQNLIITALMMDLEMGWETDKIRKSLIDQIFELKELSAENPILPFLACDPRRADIDSETENLYSLFNEAFSKSKNSFFGIKIYPALGYDPSDYRLWPIYEVCEKYKIPVLTHCGGESISTARTTELITYRGEREVPLTRIDVREMAKTLNDPNRWAIALQRFPKLKLNFAHFGGYETWLGTDEANRKETIINYMHNYENVYADFSFNLVEKRLSRNLKDMLVQNEMVSERTMFGTDYWVVLSEGNLMKKQKKFLQIIDEGYDELNLKEKLMIYNPFNYLFG